MKRLMEALAVCLLVAAGLRIGAWLVEPALPLLGSLAVFVVLAMLFFGRNRPGPPGYR